MGIYTLTALVSVVAVLALELLWLRTGLLRTLRFWLAMAIVLGFQVPVDGWLTKLSDPIVLYAEEDMTGVRAPWDIPVEDFAFGFGMVTLAMLLWVRLGRREQRGEETA
jgi:lycopene cyclase domain-containing protein